MEAKKVKVIFNAAYTHDGFYPEGIEVEVPDYVLEYANKLDIFGNPLSDTNPNKPLVNKVVTASTIPVKG